MKAIVVRPGEKDSIHMRDMPDPVMSPDHVAVRMVRVGLCGTDAEINHGLYGKPPDGDEFLILGHENLGVIVDVGKNVSGWKPGDLVVSTVRRPCGECPNCDGGENDCCSSGKYTERGIMRRHGFMSEFYVETPEYLNRIPKEVEPFAVLLEPMSVVEKGIDHAFLLQRRLMTWKPRLCVVLGGGPVGLLGAAALRARGLRTVVVAREPASDLRAQIATQIGAEYIASASGVLEVVDQVGRPDLVLEATGNAKVVFDAMEMLGANGVLCLLSVTGGSSMHEEPIDRINQLLVLGNQVVFGSVNANPRHFAQGVEDFVIIEKEWPGAMKRLLTNPIPWGNFNSWFTHRGSGIKSTLEIGA